MSDAAEEPRFFQDPCTAYDRLRSAGPVQQVPGGPEERPGYLVTGYAEARKALADPRLSKDLKAFFAGRPPRRDLHPAVARTMLATDPPRHTRLRALVTKAFTTGAVTRLRPYIQEVTDALLDRWPTEGGEADAVTGLAQPLPVTVISELLGVPEADRPDLRRWSADLFAAGRPDRIDAASHAVAGYMSGLIAGKRRRPGTTVLDDLIAARDGDDRLAEDELVSLAVLLLVAGHETTTDFIGNALLTLLRHPDALARLREDPESVPAALDELLRHDGPVSIATFRYTTEPFVLGDTTVPEGTPVLVSPAAANRDAARFPEPDRLDLDRDAGGHLAFGYGIHRCLGAPLARAEAEIALGSVLTRFPALRLAGDPGGLEWRRTRLMRGLVSLPVLT